MLVELGLVDHRYKVVYEVLDGATVVDVPGATGWSATVHDWLRANARSGIRAGRP